MPGRQFVDRQVDGPFSSWEHVHRFVPIDDERSELLDHIEYSLPAGGLTDAVGEGPAGKTLSRLFRFRHERTRLDLGRHAEWADRPRLTVAIAGASGLIGSHLADYLTTAGHRVDQAGAQQGGRDRTRSPGTPPPGRCTTALSRASTPSSTSRPSRSTASGPRAARRPSSTAACRRRGRSPRRSPAWTPRRRSSSACPRSAPTAPGAARPITEQTTSGRGLPRRRLPGLGGGGDPGRGRRRPPGHPRQGHRHERGRRGALPAMLPAFKAGLGARLGDGDQYWSWVALDDLLAAFEWALHDEELEGVVNFTAPEPVTNREVTRTLGRVLRRPAALAAPAFVLRHGTAAAWATRCSSRASGPCPRGSRSAASASRSRRSRARCATSSGAAEPRARGRRPQAARPQYATATAWPIVVRAA